ncbi:MAG: Crp/Fnr family transcriptional regulator [Phormidesmis sp.]
MTKPVPESAEPRWIAELTENNFLFRGMAAAELSNYLSAADCPLEKLYSGRPIYTAYLPDEPTDYLYALVSGGPVMVRSAPLDRAIALTYPGSCFGILDLDLEEMRVARGFPSLVEAYKTTDAVKIPRQAVRAIYKDNSDFRDRYHLLLELKEKFQYHLLNCSTYPPQAVAALLRALIYQERSLGNQPQQTDSKTGSDIFCFDLPVDIIARACQLNHRTVEQVLKGMIKVNLLKANAKSETASDLVRVCDAEGLKAVYGATRDKVSWWPLR